MNNRSNNDAGSTGGDSTASSNASNNSPNSASAAGNPGHVATIVEDDQQLYDWGIENRMDQYYQVSSYIVPHFSGINCATFAYQNLYWSVNSSVNSCTTEAPNTIMQCHRSQRGKTSC